MASMLAIESGTQAVVADKIAWADVCSVNDIVVGTGVAALLKGHQIAIFRPTAAGPLFALSNFDPFSQAFVISRGILGDKNGTLKVASPIFKQNFALEDGQCLDDPSVRLPVYPVRIEGGRVFVGFLEGNHHPPGSKP